MEIVNGTFTEPLRRVMTDIRDLAGSARGSADPRTVVSRAFQGRVMDLLIAADAEYWGAWNEDVQEVDVRRRREDLLNAAALQTLRHGGRAFRAGGIGYAGEVRGGRGPFAIEEQNTMQFGMVDSDEWAPTWRCGSCAAAIDAGIRPRFGEGIPIGPAGRCGRRPRQSASWIMACDGRIAVRQHEPD